jgi:peptidoglycan DL-endopeptidase CwlO
MSLAEVTSRIAQLQAQLGLQAGGALGGGAAGINGTSGTGTTSGAAFSSALTDALGLPAQTTSPPSTTSGERAVALARDYLGVPYQWGGTDPSKGLDCSGLTQLVYGRLGVSLPRVAADQAKAGVAVPSLAQAQPGDLVFFGSPAHHVGIVVGDGTMIDAPHTGTTVGVHAISGYGPISAIRRVVPTVAAGSLSGAGGSSGVPDTGTAGVDGTTGALAVARAQLLSAAGLSSLSSLSSPTSSDPLLDQTYSSAQSAINAWEALQ